MVATEDLPELELVCFGTPKVGVYGKEPPPDVMWRKHHALLICLAFSPGRERSRDHLMGTLWPEKPQEKARHSLNEAVRRLRMGLGAGRLLSYSDRIGMASSGLTVDVEVFSETAERDPCAALAQVHGDFLEDFSVNDAPAVGRWADAERVRYRDVVTSCLLGQAERSLAANRFVEAQDYSRKALALNPYLEPAANLTMRALALSGDATGALVSYHAFVQSLRAGIGESPGRELSALSERIRVGRWQCVGPRRAPDEPPLAGREEACGRVFSFLDEALQSGPGVFVLVGDPGMGKTRLLEDCAKRAALKGAVVSFSRPLPSDHDAPWSTLGLMLGGGLVSAPGLAAADPKSLALVAHISPKLADRFQPAKPSDSAQLATALGGVLCAIADEQPTALLVDDAHLADGPSIDSLGAALQQLRDVPVAVILASEGSTESGSAELAKLRASVGRDLWGSSLTLAPLTLEDTAELVRMLVPWCARPEEHGRLARRVHYESSGSPFWALTLLRGLQSAPSLRDDLLSWPPPKSTYESPFPFAIPDLANLAVLARISDLDNTSLRVLSAASIAGTALDLELFAMLSEVSAKQLEEALDVLERHRFLVFDSVRYAFVAPLLASIIRGECLTHGQRQRQRLRGLAVEHLTGRGDLESRVLRVELLSKLERDRSVFEEAVGIARAALGNGAGRTVSRALVAAERVARELDEEARSVLAELRSKVIPKSH